MSNTGGSRFFAGSGFTTLNGELTYPSATITVADTSSLPSSGNVIIGGSNIAYTGKTATTFTGCSGGWAGTYANGTGVLQENKTFNGPVRIGASGASGGRLYSGSGAPTLSATAGDFYFRTDTPSTVDQRIYVCTGGTSWTALV